MTALRGILESLGCESVRTYIQSGNVVLSAPAAPDATVITTAIETHFGFAPRVLVIAGDRFESVSRANPYKDRKVEGKHLHVSYLAGPASADVARLEARKGPREAFTLTSDALYLLGVEATSRNWNTVCKLLEMLA